MMKVHNNEERERLQRKREGIKRGRESRTGEKGDNQEVSG